MGFTILVYSFCPVSLCAGAGRVGLVPIFAGGGGGRFLWLRFLRGGEKERSAGSDFCGGRKRNVRLAPIFAVGGKGTFGWLPFLPGAETERGRGTGAVRPEGGVITWGHIAIGFKKGL